MIFVFDIGDDAEVEVPCHNSYNFCIKSTSIFDVYNIVYNFSSFKRSTKLEYLTEFSPLFLLLSFGEGCNTLLTICFNRMSVFKCQKDVQSLSFFVLRVLLLSLRALTGPLTFSFAHLKTQQPHNIVFECASVLCIYFMLIILLTGATSATEFRLLFIFASLIHCLNYTRYLKESKSEIYSGGKHPQKIAANKSCYSYNA